MCGWYRISPCWWFDPFHPLIVALHRQAGNPIRAPREIGEVAADIRDRLREAEERVRTVTSS